MDDCQHKFRVHAVTDLDGVKGGPVTLKLCVRCGRPEEAILKDKELAEVRVRMEAAESNAELFNKKVKEEMIRLTRGNGRICAPVGILAWVVCQLAEEQGKRAELQLEWEILEQSLKDMSNWKNSESDRANRAEATIVAMRSAMGKLTVQIGVYGMASGLDYRVANNMRDIIISALSNTDGAEHAERVKKLEEAAQSLVVFCNTPTGSITHLLDKVKDLQAVLGEGKQNA